VTDRLHRELQDVALLLAEDVLEQILAHRHPDDLVNLPVEDRDAGVAGPLEELLELQKGRAFVQGLHVYPGAHCLRHAFFLGKGCRVEERVDGLSRERWLAPRKPSNVCPKTSGVAFLYQRLWLCPSIRPFLPRDSTLPHSPPLAFFSPLTCMFKTWLIICPSCASMPPDF
jgi:hypothetical protein